MKLISDTDRGQVIKDAYLSYYEAYTNRRWDDMLRQLADDLTMFGTGIDELGFDGERTRSLLRREFSQSPTPMKYEVKSIDVYEISKDVALLMIVMDISLQSRDQEVICPNNRTSAIMVKEDGQWKLAHGHWSQPDRDIDVGESVPYRLLIQRSKELEEKVARRTRKIEEQKEELQKVNKTKDKLFSVIAHDLKGPFNSILGFSEILSDQFDHYDRDKVKEMIHTIHAQASSTYALLENLLEWARSQTDMIQFSPDRISLSELFRSATDHLTMMVRDKHISLVCEAPDHLYVYADRRLLETVLRNLLHNALKFTGAGGWVSLTAETKDSSGVLVAVRDNGPGIREEVQEKILNGANGHTLAGTCKEGGTGLGLMLCREFLALHGSRLTIDSQPGEGSCFSFQLPATG